MALSLLRHTARSRRIYSRASELELFDGNIEMATPGRSSGSVQMVRRSEGKIGRT
jgi:hypothetical protein